MRHIIETDNLTFRFPRGPVIADGIALAVPQGSIYGLLGENGAGKSSLMRLLTGLLRPQAGRVQLFAQAIEKSQPIVFQEIGLVLEHPRLYPNLTAREYLRVFTTYRKLPATRCARVLQDVGLAAYARQRIKTFSTGMRQRLALAQALLPQGDLLILDEPTNGLDPGGIALVRQLLQREQERGTTILVSSHLLSELEQICTHIGILHQGQLLFQGTLQELGELQREALHLRLVCSEPDAALPLLREQFLRVDKAARGQLMVDIANQREANRVVDLLRAAEIEVYELHLVRPQLEDLFLQLTQS